MMEIQITYDALVIGERNDFKFNDFVCTHVIGNCISRVFNGIPEP